MHERRRFIPVVILVVAALGFGGWYWWSHRTQTADGQVVVSGTVDADQVQVTSLIGGRVVEATLAEGDVVAAGAPLYRIDDAALKLQVDQAAAAVRAAAAALKQAKDDDKSDADIAAAKAALEQARAAEKIARIQLAYARISSPASGTVTSIAIMQGELASPGRTMATITKTGSLFVRAFVPETQIGAVEIGQSASLVTDAGVKRAARVTFIASEAQFTPSNVETKEQRAKLVYEVRLEPDRTEGLTPGMPVTVAIGQ